MNTDLDMRTLITVLVVGHVISLVLLIVDYRYSRRQKGDLFFIFGRLGQLIGLIMIAQRGELSFLLTVLVGNSLVMTGHALESTAWVSLKTKMSRRWWIFYGVSLAVILACVWNTPFSLSRATRMSVPIVLQCVFLLIPGVQLIFSRAGSSPTQKIIGALYIVGVLASLWRYQYIMSMNKYNLFMTGLPHIAFFVVLIFLLVGGSQGYILIKKEYLNQELVESNRNLRQEKETVVYYETELRKRELERAELKVLQAQIKPHFLQNTLGAISHFCRVDAAKAQQLLHDLAVYLRGTFELTADCVPLEEELKLVRAYLGIEAVRFGPRLDVKYELAADLSDCRIPPFTLQPLVENAVRHGIAAKRDGGVIRICIQAADGGFTFLVEDDGAGISADFARYFANRGLEARPDGQGLGLFSVDRRLRSIFGQGLKIEGAAGQGTRISFVIPSAAGQGGGQRGCLE